MDYPGEEVSFGTVKPAIMCDCTPAPNPDPPEQYFTPSNPRPVTIHFMFWTMKDKRLVVKVVWSDGHEREFDWFSQSRNILNIQQQMVEQNHA